MAIVHARRTAVAVGAVVAVLASPLAGAAVGAPAAFEASSITTDPAPDGSNVVAANRPTVVAEFSDKLSATSTIQLVEKGTADNLCTSFQVKGKTVSCTPTSDLALETTYDAVGHGVATSGAKANTKHLEFTVSYPKLQPNQGAPIAGGSDVAGGETLLAQFDQPVSGDGGSFKVFEVNLDGTRGVQLPGTVAFPKTLQGDSDGSVTFKPANALQKTAPGSSGKYEAVLLVNGVDGGDPNPKAIGAADYYFWVNDTPPADLATPDAPANNVNSSEFPFTGTAPVGTTVTVTVEDPSDPTGLNPPKGSVVVPTCDAAPICPWTVKVDVSGLGDADGTADNGANWSAVAADPNGKKTASTAGAPFVIDQTPPDQPTVTATAPDGSDTVTTTVRVSASYGPTDDSTGVTSYHVTITDQEDNTVEQDYPADGSKNLPATDVDVTTLDDGTLTVLAQAEDAAGNRSNYSSNPLDPKAPTVTKKAGLLPNLGTSTFTTDGSDTTFVDAVDGVHSPGTVTLRFTQTIKESYTDNNDPRNGTHHSALCLTTVQGNCVAGGSPTVTDDHRGLVIKPSSSLPDGHYGVKATTYSQNNCPNVNPGGTDTCESFDGVVLDPATGQPYVFTVDNTAPTVKITGISPNPITSKGVDDVTIAGTVSADATGVQLVIRSNGGKGARLAAATVTPHSGAASSWSSGSLDLSALPDGRLTIKAKATDEAGNTGADTAHARLKAHESRLAEHATDNRIRFGQSVRIAGRLRDQNGDPIVSATITVQPRFVHHRLGQPQTATTNSKGHWSLLVAPRQNARFYASYDGTTSKPIHDQVTTHRARVFVRALVKIARPDSGASRRHVTVKGKVRPNKRHEVVRLYRKTRHGATLLDRDRLNRHSHFVFRVRLPHGKVRLFVRIGRTTGNLAGRSAYVVLRVR